MFSAFCIKIECLTLTGPLRRLAMSEKDSPKKIKDRGGSRSGIERRRKKSPSFGVEKRTGKDRRSGLDRRKGSGRKRLLEEGRGAERRDVFRQTDNGKV